MSASRTIRAAGAWGHLLLVVLALGVFAMHTVGHPATESEMAHGDMGHVLPLAPTSDTASTSAASVTPASAPALAESADPAGPIGVAEPPQFAESGHFATSVPSAMELNQRLRAADANPPSAAAPLSGAVPGDEPVASAPRPPVGTAGAAGPSQRTTAHPTTAGTTWSSADHRTPATTPVAAPGPLPPSPTGPDVTAPSWELLAASAPESSAEREAQAGTRDHGMTVDMASLCVAVLSSWALVALLWSALGRGRDQLSSLRSAALAVAPLRIPPPRPDLARLSILRT